MSNKRRSNSVTKLGYSKPSIKKRRIIQTTQVLRSRRPFRKRKIWLDILPSELRCRIASYVSAGEQTHSALCLAQTNLTQRQAVLSTLSYKLNLSIENRHGAEWMDVFGHETRTLVVEDDFFGLFNLGSHPDPITFIQTPSLRRAEILDEPAVLRAIAMSHVRELKVSVYGLAPQHLLLDTLKRLHLTSLELHCIVVIKKMCPFNRFTQALSVPVLEALTACCPTLSVLKMKCAYHGHNNPLGRVVRLLPKLREVTVVTEPPKDALVQLCSIESVRICNAPNALQLAMELGSNVTCLVTSESLDATQVADLVRCPRLSHLAIDVKEGAERSLLKIVRAMHSLRSLKLKWPRPEIWIALRYRWNGLCFTKADADAILRAIEVAPDLVELDLRYVRVPTHQLTEILLNMGPRLKHFGTSIWDQDEAPFDQLEILIRALTRHNSGLCSFEVSESIGREKELLRTVYTTEEPLEMRTSQECRLRYALRVLKRSAPMMNTDELEDFISSMKGDGWPL